jgi:hypothetical protein
MKTYIILSHYLGAKFLVARDKKQATPYLNDAKSWIEISRKTYDYAIKTTFSEDKFDQIMKLKRITSKQINKILEG